MIVESMSLKEVNDQMVKDMPLLQEWAEWKIGYELRSKFAIAKCILVMPSGRGVRP